MGTRADFYIFKEDHKLEWVGSVANDGYPDNEDLTSILKAVSLGDFLTHVEALLEQTPSATSPEDGWPWPWEDSGTTDYAYVFMDGATHFEVAPDVWVRSVSYKPEFPTMDRNNYAKAGTKRSGIMLVHENKETDE